TTARPRTERCSTTSPSRGVRASTTAPGISADSIALSSARSTFASLRRIRLHCMRSPTAPTLRPSPAPHPRRARFEHLERARGAVDRSARADGPRAVVLGMPERQARDGRGPDRAGHLHHDVLRGGLGIVVVDAPRERAGADADQRVELAGLAQLLEHAIDLVRGLVHLLE